MHCARAQLHILSYNSACAHTNGIGVDSPVVCMGSHREYVGSESTGRTVFD